MMDWSTFNQPQEPITTDDQLYAITYRVYQNSPLTTSHLYAKTEADAVDRFIEWLGEHWSVQVTKLNFSVWNLRGDNCDWDMICTGLKHRNAPLYTALKL